MSQPTRTKENPITLDSVFKDMRHWRKHKNEYPEAGIPDGVWRKIFQLEDSGYTTRELKRLFTLNSKQHDLKRCQLRQSHDHNRAPLGLKMPQSQPEQTENPAVFCEAVVKTERQQNIPALTQAANNTKKALSTLKSTHQKADSYLDLTTIIVECIRPDGQRLKIHTTSQSLDTVMQAFFEQGVSLS